MKKWLFITLLGLAQMNLSCSNIFAGVANKTTDEAHYEEAIKALNKADYDSAVDLFESLSPGFVENTEVRFNMAGAYAGQCGFDFASFFTSITTGSIGSDPLFVYLMKFWTNSITLKNSCRLSEDTMKLINPTYATRTAKESLFMVLLAMTKIGIYLREIADIDRDGIFDPATFDGSVASFCSAANISDINVSEIGAAFGIMLSNLTNVGTILSGNPVDTVAIDTACNALTPNPCAIEDEATILADAPTVKAFRTLLNTPVVGHPTGLPCP